MKALSLAYLLSWMLATRGKRSAPDPPGREHGGTRQATRGVHMSMDMGMGMHMDMHMDMACAIGVAGGGRTVALGEAGISTRSQAEIIIL